MSAPQQPIPEQTVKVGYVRRAHGVRGAVIVRVLGDEFDHFSTGRTLLTDDPHYPALTVVAAHPHKDGWLVTFEQVSTRDIAEELRGTSFLIDAEDRRQLDDDEFWPEQLVGLAVVDGDGRHLGVVTGLVGGSAQDRLVVTSGDVVTEVPFVRAIVTAVSPADGVVKVDPPRGLFPD